MLSFHTQVLVWLYQYTVAWESQYLLPMSCLPTSSWGQVAPWLWLQPFQSVVSRSAACRKLPPGRWGCPQQAESGHWYAGWPSVPLLKGWSWYRWSSWNWFLQATGLSNLPRCSAPAAFCSLLLKGVPLSTTGPDRRRIWLPGLYKACLRQCHWWRQGIR